MLKNTWADACENADKRHETKRIKGIETKNKQNNERTRSNGIYSYDIYVYRRSPPTNSPILVTVNWQVAGSVRIISGRQRNDCLDRCASQSYTTEIVCARIKCSIVSVRQCRELQKNLQHVVTISNKQFSKCCRNMELFFPLRKTHEEVRLVKEVKDDVKN